MKPSTEAQRHPSDYLVPEIPETDEFSSLPFPEDLCLIHKEFEEWRQTGKLPPSLIKLLDLEV